MTDSRREEWLRARRGFLTASDAAAVLGEDPRRGPFEVAVEKVHGYQPTELRVMRRGQRMEPVIAGEYADETGRPVLEPDPYTLTVHPTIPWLAATLDRKTQGSELEPAPFEGWVPLELKNLSGQKVTAAEFREDPPVHFQIQAQIQLACTAEQGATLAAMIGGYAVAWHDMLPHNRFLAAAFPRLEAFWLKVQRRELPEADGLPGTTAAIKALYSHRSNGDTVPLDGVDLAMADELERLISAQVDRAQQVQELENKLRARIGDATFGALPDGSFLKLPLVSNPGYTATVKPFTYRPLKRWRPRLRRRTG